MLAKASVMATESDPSASAAAPDRSIQDRIMDVAETLFAEHGFSGTSTRAIARGAGVNLGQLHYYFGSKRDLFKAVFLRHGRQITDERRRSLDEAQARWPDGRIPLEVLIRSFVTPFMLSGKTPKGQAIMRMHARLHTEPDEIAREVRSLVYDETTLAYVDALRLALPELPPEVIYWRLYFTMGAYSYTLLRSGRLEVLSRGECDSGDFDTAVEQIVPFLCAGMAAPPPAPRR